jgi:2-oxo-4-hydroxy-4-carboxy-5-ureidoimidazoline decarboxylase
VTEGIGLSAWNALPYADAVVALRGCCASTRWAQRVTADRPYATPEQLYAAAERVLAELDETDVDEALAAHPRIGDRPNGADSRREQSGVGGASSDTKAELAAANRAYEERFGHVYLVCATGKDADELLAILRSRLGNDPATERRVLRGELAKINDLRLRRLLHTTDGRTEADA